MSGDRMQAAWHYISAEIWRPLFRRFATDHPDLPIEIVRTMLVRRRMAEIFVETGRYDALDALRADAATYLDSEADARTALRRIKPHFFASGRAISILLSDISIALEEYDNPDLMQAYMDLVAKLLERHALPYRLNAAPLRLVPLLNGEMDALYATLRIKAAENQHLSDALTEFEEAWERHMTDGSQTNTRAAIRTAALLAENMVVNASDGAENEFTRALNRMRNQNRFPSNDFVNIFDRAYTFANTYPNIRHPGNPAVVRRDLRREDALLAAMVFIGLSACAQDLCVD